jgi:IS5 family transposase
MKQADLGLNLSRKKTRKREFLEEMTRVVPWKDLTALIEPHYPKGKTGRPPMGLEVMLRVHLLQQWFGLSDPAMEEALHDVPLYREFAGLEGPMRRLPDESTILRFRHLLEKHNLGDAILATVNVILQRHGLMLKAGTVVDATLISALSRAGINRPRRVGTYRPVCRLPRSVPRGCCQTVILPQISRDDRRAFSTSGRPSDPGRMARRFRCSTSCGADGRWWHWPEAGWWRMRGPIPRSRDCW